MSTPDFEINVGLRARELVPRRFRTTTEPTGDGLSLDRAETRDGLPIAEPDQRYENIVVDKRTVGEVTERRDDPGTPPSKQKAGG